MTHTPKPWYVTGPAEPEWGLDPTQPEERDFDFQEIHGSDGDLVALAAGTANARFIVQAVNAHEELLAALEELLEWESRMGGWDAPCWEKARAAIAKAKGI